MAENQDKELMECIAVGGNTAETCGYKEKAKTEAKGTECAKLHAKEVQGQIIEVRDRIGPFIYSFSYAVRPGEEPIFKDPGNVRPFDRDLKPPADRSIMHVNDIENFYEIQIKLPGVEKSNIDLEFYEDNIVVVTGDEKRYHGQIVFSVPVETNTVSAEYKNGVLYIRMGKAKEYKPGSAIGTKIPVS